VVRHQDKYPDGSTTVYSYYKDSEGTKILHGKYTERDSAGNVKSILDYKNGVLTGTEFRGRADDRGL
jgi:antitoxin component YwqK of YwqJK toxin-antitoxin module